MAFVQLATNGREKTILVFGLRHHVLLALATTTRQSYSGLARFFLGSGVSNRTAKGINPAQSLARYRHISSRSVGWPTPT